MHGELLKCQNPPCLTAYDWRKSSSRFLKMTFCSYTCERAANGFLIEDFDDVVQDTWKKEIIRARLYGAGALAQ